uniref:Uncharacterized protein n=1 Tax=Arundo donax TaxID=35708 RepID=A0A0A9M9D1_ARUDO
MCKATSMNYEFMTSMQAKRSQSKRRKVNKEQSISTPETSV